MIKDETRPFPSLPTIKFVLLCLLLSAFWLRLHHIDAFGFWTDEGLTPLRSGYSILEILSNRVIIQQGVTNDTHPAFFFLIIHFTRLLFGETDFAYRFPATLAGVLLLPLIYQFGRRLRDRRLGGVAAALTAVNPLYLWYADEARMYTIFVLLAAAASYVLWRAISPQSSVLSPHPSSLIPQSSPLAKYLLLYILFAGLALYTHYTAVFLIAAQSLFWVWLLWQRGQKRLIVGTAVLGLLLTIPLIPYTVPRLFKGVEANFYFVRPAVMLKDVFQFFALGTVVDYKRLLIQLLVWGFGLLLLLGVWGARSRLKRTFLLSYLFATVFGLMAGSLLFKPMYQGARHIIVGSPAFILLVSWGILWLWTVFSNRLSVIGDRKTAQPITDYRLLITFFLALVATAVPLIGSAIAINNLYNNPHYGKDGFREMIRFIEQTAGDNDVIVYNNAILLPLHDHYQQREDVVVTGSPIYPTYAENTAVPQLEALAATYDRIWYVTDPPADNRDRNKLVKQWLDAHLTLIDDYPFPARTTSLSTIVYDTKTDAELAETAVSLNLQWPNIPTLTAVSLRTQQPVNTPAFWVDLYWQGDVTANAWLRFVLRGPDGKDWVLSEQSLIPDAEAMVWVDNQPMRLQYPIHLPLGTPPGTYTLLVQPFAADGGAYGDFQPLTDVAIADSGEWMAVAERPFAPATAVSFKNGISLQGVELAAGEVRPGHVVPMTLYWQTDNEAVAGQDLSYKLLIRHPSGEILREVDGKPGPDWLEQWPADVVMRQPTGLYFPPDTPPGRYLLSWQLTDGDLIVPGRPFWRPWRSDSVRLGEIEVVPWPLETTLPTDVNVIEAQFGDAIQLYGYTLTENDTLHLTLYWLADTIPTQNYFVFVHLVDEAGNIVVQRDIIPVDGLRPTTGWRPNELLTDVHTLAVPDSLPDGIYALRVGLFEPNTFARPTVTYQGEAQADNQLELTTVIKP